MVDDLFAEGLYALGSNLDVVDDLWDLFVEPWTLGTGLGSQRKRKKERCQKYGMRRRGYQSLGEQGGGSLWYLIVLLYVPISLSIYLSIYWLRVLYHCLTIVRDAMCSVVKVTIWYGPIKVWYLLGWHQWHPWMVSQSVMTWYVQRDPIVTVLACLLLDARCSMLDARCFVLL